VGLTAVQEQVLRTFAVVDDAGTFALAGGGAINVLGVSDRFTHDLDLFTPAADQALRVVWAS